MSWQWITTAPDPLSARTGYDAGQRGWRLHAVAANDTETLAEIRDRRSACGLWPAHGWSLDLFIEDRCMRCVKRLGLPLTFDEQREALMRKETRELLKSQRRADADQAGKVATP